MSDPVQQRAAEYRRRAESAPDDAPAAQLYALLAIEAQLDRLVTAAEALGAIAETGGTWR